MRWRWKRLRLLQKYSKQHNFISRCWGWDLFSCKFLILQVWGQPQNFEQGSNIYCMGKQFFAAFVPALPSVSAFTWSWFCVRFNLWDMPNPFDLCAIYLTVWNLIYKSWVLQAIEAVRYCTWETTCGNWINATISTTTWFICLIWEFPIRCTFLLVITTTVMAPQRRRRTILTRTFPGAALPFTWAAKENNGSDL